MTVPDADRDRVIAVLREQAGEGRLDLDEFGQRLDEAYQATTFEDLRHALRELPVHVPLGEQAAPTAPTASGLAASQGPTAPRRQARPAAPPRPGAQRYEERHRERHLARQQAFNAPERVDARHAAAKAAWGAHLGAYLSVNLMLVVIWFLTGADSHFWPMWPMMGWGIGLASHGMAHAAGSSARRRKLDR